MCFDLGGVLVRICRSWDERCQAAGLDVRGAFASDPSGGNRREDLSRLHQTGRIGCAEFFDADKYPEITFRSTRIEPGRNGGFLARGTLSIRDAAREIALPFRVAGPIKDPRAGARLGVETRLRLNRQDYGIKYHQVLDNGVLALANDVDIEIGLEAIPAKPVP